MRLFRKNKTAKNDIGDDKAMDDAVDSDEQSGGTHPDDLSGDSKDHNDSTTQELAPTTSDDGIPTPECSNGLSSVQLEVADVHVEVADVGAEDKSGTATAEEKPGTATAEENPATAATAEENPATTTAEEQPTPAPAAEEATKKKKSSKRSSKVGSTSTTDKTTTRKDGSVGSPKPKKKSSVDSTAVTTGSKDGKASKSSSKNDGGDKTTTAKKKSSKKSDKTKSSSDSVVSSSKETTKKTKLKAATSGGGTAKTKESKSEKSPGSLGSSKGTVKKKVKASRRSETRTNTDDENEKRQRGKSLGALIINKEDIVTTQKKLERRRSFGDKYELDELAIATTLSQKQLDVGGTTDEKSKEKKKTKSDKKKSKKASSEAVSEHSEETDPTSSTTKAADSDSADVNSVPLETVPETSTKAADSDAADVNSVPLETVPEIRSSDAEEKHKTELKEMESEKLYLTKELATERQEIAEIKDMMKEQAAESKKVQEALEERKAKTFTDSGAATEKENEQLHADLGISKMQIKGLEQDVYLHGVENHKIQQQLSETLEKIVKVSEEQGRVKDSLLVTSTKLTETTAALANSTAEVSDLKAKLVERNSEAEENKKRIASLEMAVDTQLDNQDALEVKLEAADEEIDKMETEMKLLDEEIGVLKTKNEELMDLCEELDEARRVQDDLQITIDEQVLLLDEKERKIKTLEQEMGEHSDLLQKVESLTQENVGMQGKLKSEQLEIGVRLAKKEDAIAFLQKEIAELKKDSGSHVSGEFTALSKELKQCQKQIALARDDLEDAQRRIGCLEEENEDLQLANGTLKGELKTLESGSSAFATKAEEMQEKISHWTEKTFEWKLRAETAEKKLETAQSGAGSDSEDGGPQALFLQAAMERKRASVTTAQNKPANKWALFRNSRNLDDKSSECNPEDSLTKIECRNEILEDQIAKLQSDMVKLQTAYKEESYTNTKKLEELQNENSAYSLKNAALVKLVGDVHFADDQQAPEAAEGQLECPAVC
jgi:hypothetical protein